MCCGFNYLLHIQTFTQSIEPVLRSRSTVDHGDALITQLTPTLDGGAKKRTMHGRADVLLDLHALRDTERP